MACPNMDSCALYTQFLAESLAKPWISAYCTTKFDRCERYKLSTEGKPVPLTLLPNGMTLTVPGVKVAK